MDLTIAEELDRAFDLASLRREARTIGRPHQWRAANDHLDRCRHAREREQRLYQARYPTRVEAARRRLIDEAAKKGFELKPRWAGDDRFDKAAIQRQAERDVRRAHEGRLLRIEEFERQGLRAIVHRSMRENNMRGVARDGFDRAADRRAGIERRGSQREGPGNLTQFPRGGNRPRNRPRDR
ncbi:MAG: hypothetical protein J0H53_24990 [Rhizobiales bacterium]|nr:hypothetical protein [Hyphomicrobiales bacterium]OJU31106.1 MAG: hypothetical protein BGN94_22445 [Rhizobiales bacterium 68-8]